MPHHADHPPSGFNRRKFLRNSLLTGLGAGLSPLALQAEQPASLETGFSGNTKKEDLAPLNGTITLLQTTDVHCQIHPHDELFWENGQAVFRKTAGYAHLATLFDQVRKKNPNTFIIDTGDMFQGSELSVKTTGKAISPILNAMGYDLYLPGNWEVVYYKKAMQTLLGGLDAPKVCANMYHDAGDGKKGELIFPAYFTWSRLGVKIGFLGYTDPLVPIRQSPNYSKGIIYTKPEENLAYYVDVMRDQEQCDVVIILAHLGLSQQIALANMPECEGVDYIFGGDTHERVREPIECKYAKVVEPGAFGSFVGRLDLEVKDGKVTAQRYELMEVDPRKYKAKKEVSALIAQLEAPFVADIDRVVGYSKVPLYRYFVVENTIDTLILDALEWKVGTEIVLSNGFRFCPPRSTPNAEGLIPITEGFIYDMLPVDATVRTAKVTGAELLKWLEKELNNVFSKDASRRFGGWVVKFRGMEVAFNAFGEQGKRVQKVTVGGSPLDPARAYTVSACERDGDPDTMLCRIPSVTEGKNMPYSLHPVLKEYLAANSPVSPLPHGSAKVLDAPATLLTQVSGVKYEFR
ncbi:MAG TPA: bifunctional metallophosphatase/5'-nucleotidase [Saprospiraceae bacterium]|nr:bifunctional metallophosphatase/5'-nucleotidase [Saprospiraceae bacterium]HPI08712.1 bifunctional metallophosphatase/5'-nucleotidase [Saprospiraceae bacterium]